MKNILTIIFCTAVPYLFIMVLWALSLGGFDYQATVTSPGFYVIAGVYWLFLLYSIPFFS